jgi:hypothetical protein
MKNIELHMKRQTSEIGIVSKPNNDERSVNDISSVNDKHVAVATAADNIITIVNFLRHYLATIKQMLVDSYLSSSQQTRNDLQRLQIISS